MRNLIVLVAVACVGCSSPSNNGENNGASNNGGSNNGASNNGGSNNGGSNNGGSNNGSGPTITASDYDQSCVTNDECFTVYEGDVCDPCRCSNAAITFGASQAYDADLEARDDDCDALDFCAADCIDRNAVCVGGTCAAAEPVFIVATDYDQSCTTPDDCVAIIEGNACGTCACATKAIAASAKAEYDADVEAAVCGNQGDVLCAPCEQFEVACNAGTCELAPL